MAAGGSQCRWSSAGADGSEEGDGDGDGKLHGC